jgi:peptidoglycan/LPS O-acetylase OafA/YrhL
MKYRAEIDGLRAIAVISVILFHAGFNLLSGGYVGVDIFFVISGYLITTIILDDIEKGKFSLSNFYERRARRILPALFCVVLASTVAAYLLLLPSQLIAFGKSVVSIPVFLSNLLFWSERGYFGEATELKPLVHTWSLSVEEQFYIVFPPLLFLTYKYIKTKLVAVLVIACAASLALSWYVTKVHFETAFYLPFTRAWELLVGALVVMAERRFSTQCVTYGRNASLLGAGLIGYSAVFYTADTVFPGVAAVLPVVGTALILLSSSSSDLIHRLLAQRPLVYVGLASYSLYLWHQPIFAFMRQMELQKNWMPAGIALTAAISAISYIFIEKPFRDRTKFTKRKIFILYGLGSASLVALGAFFVLNHGFINRFSPEDAKLLAQFAEIDEYNQKRFDSLNLKAFKNTSKRKILITGDSYAKDILNLAYEGGFEKDFEFSTKQINSECGNVYIDEDITPFISPKSAARCRVQGRYQSDAVKDLIKQADEVWLVGSWSPWVIQFLPMTIQNLESEFNVKVRVFGTKNFGEINQRIALAVIPSQRPGYRQAAQEIPSITSKLMRQTVSASNFVDVFDLFCGGSSASCEIFTPDGYLISPDGAHLTKVGAKYLATRVKPLLYKNPS